MPDRKTVIQENKTTQEACKDHTTTHNLNPAATEEKLEKFLSPENTLRMVVMGMLP